MRLDLQQAESANTGSGNTDLNLNTWIIQTTVTLGPDENPTVITGHTNKNANSEVRKQLLWFPQRPHFSNAMAGSYSSYLLTIKPPIPFLCWEQAYFADLCRGGREGSYWVFFRKWPSQPGEKTLRRAQAGGVQDSHPGHLATVAGHKVLMEALLVMSTRRKLRTFDVPAYFPSRHWLYLPCRYHGVISLKLGGIEHRVKSFPLTCGADLSSLCPFMSSFSPCALLKLWLSLHMSWKLLWVCFGYLLLHNKPPQNLLCSQILWIRNSDRAPWG